LPLEPIASSSVVPLQQRRIQPLRLRPFARKLPPLFRALTKVGQRIVKPGLILSLSMGLSQSPVMAEQNPGVLMANPTLSPSSECPSTLPTLMDRMLPDLPSYINRVRIGAGISKSYVLLAAKPDFDPLTPSNFSGLSVETQASGVRQVFFTTLMHRYDGGRIANLQEYHWVFLAQQPKDWQLVMMYSTLGVYPATPEQPPLAPRNSSDGSVAQAIKAWLEDCRSGNLIPLAKPIKRSKLKQR
jgi:hypothetical protein